MIERFFCTYKSHWAEGPWIKECDFMLWTDKKTGYTCEIMRHPDLGFLCGYVHLSKSHPYYNKDLTSWDDSIPQIDVHGGITFHNKKGNDMLVGFDCGHWGDLGDLKNKEYVEMLSQNTEVSYKDIKFVKEECTKLAKQLKNLEK